MFDVLPGCESYEAYYNPKFHVGMNDNLKNFEYITCVRDEEDVDHYSPREHPSFGLVKKGDKLKFKELSFNYGVLRCVSEEGQHIAIYDIVGNFMVQKITDRFITTNYANLETKMYERIFYLDRYGNKWALTSDKGDITLIERKKEDFHLIDYVNKSTDYHNTFSSEDYNRWRDSLDPKREILYYQGYSCNEY